MFPDFKNIFLKGPFYNGFTFVFKITAKKKPIEIISPSIIINSYNREYDSLLVNCDFIGNNKTSLFLKFISDLEKHILKKEKEILSYHSYTTNPKFISVINTWNGTNKLRCGIYNKDIEIYDINKNKISLLSLINKTTAKLIIWINEVIVNKDKWFVKLTVMQIRILDPLPPIGCLINDEEEEVEVVVEKVIHTSHNNSICDKYTKMLNMGIPLNAVKNKCKLDGINPSILDNINVSKSKDTLSIKPLFTDLTKIKLKKMVISSNKNEEYKDSRQFGPSLNDIKNQLYNLKSIKN